jgi:hypothetical protein
MPEPLRDRRMSGKALTVVVTLIVLLAILFIYLRPY